MSDQTPADSPPPPSIFDLEPLEHGGEDARQGFGLQDHVAAGLCIDMMLDASIREVWCETHDDITLLFDLGSSKELHVEFIQVKAHEFDQLWSVAKITARGITGQRKSARKMWLREIPCQRPLQRALLFSHCYCSASYG